MTPKEYIESIYNRYKNSDELVLSSLSGAINRLQKAFPKRGHFLMEFIQNADDCDAESLKIVINEKEAKVYNSGKPFSEKDVKSICQVGKSSKTPEDYIGYLGVGFKSVFLISEEPHIFSGEFKFKFDKKIHENPQDIPWQVMPIWDETVPQGTEVHWWKTSFYLPFSYGDKNNIEKIRNEIETESINSRLLLFLKNLRQIEILNQFSNIKRALRKSSIIESTSDYEIYELTEEKNKEETTSKWLLFRKQYDVPEEVKLDNMTIEWERQHVKKREVIVAFRLDNNGSLIEEEKGAAHIGVFSFLPMKEEIEGLKFLVQGDFLTAPGRETLSRKALWNEWLCSEISKLITNKCIPIFLNNVKWRMNFTTILYSENIQDHFFDVNLKKKLVDFIDNQEVLISEEGSKLKIKDAIKIGVEVREFIDESIFNSVLKGKKVLHKDCDASKLNIQEGPKDIIDLIENREYIKILEQKAKLKDIKWFKRFYRKLALKCKNNPEVSDDIRNEEFILTESYSLSNTDRVLLPTREIPEEFKHNFTLLNQELLNDEEIFNFFKFIGVGEVTDKHIRELMDEKQIPKIANEWETYSDAEKIEKLQFIFDMWNQHKVEVKNLSFLTLKTRKGSWEKPETIKLGNEFNAAFNIEKVLLFIHKKIESCSPDIQLIIKDKLNNDLTFDFLSESIVPEPKNSVWLKFLEELGVNRLLDKENRFIVNRLSVIYVLIYENQNGRKTRELTESEKRGYDIESRNESILHKIEVKGSEKSDPNLFLPAHEFEVLVSTSENDNELYYVYIVGNVYDTPKIYRLKGEDIKQADTGINLESYKWKKLTKIETI